MKADSIKTAVLKIAIAVQLCFIFYALCKAFALVLVFVMACLCVDYLTDELEKQTNPKGDE